MIPKHPASSRGNTVDLFVKHQLDFGVAMVVCLLVGIEITALYFILHKTQKAQLLLEVVTKM